MSLEQFGIINQKKFLDKLSTKSVDSIFDEPLIDIVDNTIHNSKYHIFYIISKQPYYLLFLKHSIMSGGYGSISYGYMITNTIFSILFPNKIFNTFPEIVNEIGIDKLILLLEKNNINQLVVKYPLEDRINSYSLLVENTIFAILYDNKITKKYIPQLVKIFQHQGSIYTIMEKLDGSIHYDLKKIKLKNKLKGKKTNIYDNFILSYILQIAYGLYTIYQQYPIFSHRDLKPNNTMYKIVKTNNITIELDDISFNYPSYGYQHYIIDFGFSCLNEYSAKNMGDCSSKSRDLTQFIFVLLNFNYMLLSDKVIGYLTYLLDINPKCNLWRNIYSKKLSRKKNQTKKNTSLCNSINGFDKYLYRYLNQTDFDNPKAYPENIIKDIYNNIDGELPYNKLGVSTYRSYLY